MTATESIKERILDVRPSLKTVEEATTMSDYFKPALEWKADPELFPHLSLFLDILESNAERLYPGHGASIRAQVLKNTFFETGGHTHLPKSYDSQKHNGRPSVNRLVFQGQVLIAAARYKSGQRYSISLSSGITGGTNINGGRELQLCSDPEMSIRLLYTKYKDTPHFLIPTQDIDDPKVTGRYAQIRKGLSPKQREIFTKVREQMAGVDTVFSEQVARAHAAMMNCILPEEIQQVTIDYEPIIREFSVHLLREEGSLIREIFSDDQRRLEFIKELSGTDQGWSKEQGPFTNVKRKDKKPITIRENYDGPMDPDTLADLIESRQIVPRTLWRFIITMLESGVCSIGGMNQIEYLTITRNKICKLLEKWGYKKRAAEIRKIPLNIAIVSPSWGTYQNGQLLDLIGFTVGKAQIINGTSRQVYKIVPNAQEKDPSLDRVRLTPESFEYIMSMSGADALTIGGPSLAAFLLGEDDLSELMSEASRKAKIVIETPPKNNEDKQS